LFKRLLIKVEEQIKNIVANYTKLPVEQINVGTVIDRSAVTSSILLHRMYAHLSNEGFVVDNYWDIKTFGALLQKFDGHKNVFASASTPEANQYSSTDINDQSPSIGIDIEEVHLMPVAADFREDEFYTMNFSPAEIAYCILQVNPYASFAGLFAAKEAIIKADNQFINSAFSTIVIDHLPNGKPIHPLFQISISHTSTTVIAVAIKMPSIQNNAANYPTASAQIKSPPSLFPLYFLLFVALAISSFTLFFTLINK